MEEAVKLHPVAQRAKLDCVKTTRQATQFFVQINCKEKEKYADGRRG